MHEVFLEPSLLKGVQYPKKAARKALRILSPGGTVRLCALQRRAERWPFLGAGSSARFQNARRPGPEACFTGIQESRRRAVSTRDREGGSRKERNRSYINASERGRCETTSERSAPNAACPSAACRGSETRMLREPPCCQQDTRRTACSAWVSPRRYARAGCARVTRPDGGDQDDRTGGRRHIQVVRAT